MEQERSIDAPSTTRDDVYANVGAESDDAASQVEFAQTASVSCRFTDFACTPIEGLKYAFMANGQSVAGKTDAQGKATELTELPPGCYVDVLVFREHSQDYKNIGAIYAYPGQTDYDIVSPKIKFEAETEPHRGEPGKAEDDKPPAPQQIESQNKSGTANPAPAPANAAKQIQASNAQSAPPKDCPIASGRNKQGNPQATVQDKNEDWLKRILLAVFNIWTWDAFKSKAPSHREPGCNETANKKTSLVAGAKSAQQATPPKPGDVVVTQAHPQINPALPASTVAAGKELPKNDLEALQRLIEIAEEQVTKNYAQHKPITNTLLDIYSKGKTPEYTEKPATKFMGFCLAYVKVALNRAKYITGNSGTINAKDSVADWPRYGFADVTKSLPTIEIAYEDVYADKDVPTVKRRLQQQAALAAKKEQRKKQKKPMSASEISAEEKTFTKLPDTTTIKITQPDLMYTLPGDIIVYEQVSPVELNPPGHVEIRTYHGFASDAVWPRPIPALGVGTKNRYRVIGVFRKISDTMAMVRVQAFLKIVREYETQGFSEAESYFALPDGKNPTNNRPLKRKFTSTATHPYSKDSPEKYDTKDYYGNLNTSAGAYQIKVKTWLEAIEANGWPRQFNSGMQTRIAMYRLQFRDNESITARRTALGYLMEGNLDKALSDTPLPKEWSWLPGGVKPKLSTSDLTAKFHSYTQDMLK